MVALQIVNEYKRKLFHLLCLVYGGLYYFLPKLQCIRVMGVLGLMIILLEGLRLRSPAFNRWAWARVSSIARAWEKHMISGVFWTWVGCFVTILVFPRREIVLTALSFMIFGDAAAAVAGKLWGRHFWPGGPGKSVEGSVAFALAATAAGLWFMPAHVVFISALAVAGLESLRLPVDDNLWIPLVSGACLSLVSLI
jgi:dolichol kinase